MAFDLDNLEYLALEGGGGRGILYLEPVRILEDRLRSKIEQSIQKFRGRPLSNVEFSSVSLKYPSLFQIDIPPQYRVLKGISGSSAGAITAYMLSLGMSSFDIQNEMDRIDVRAKESLYDGPISVFEQFVDEKPNNLYRAIENGEVKLNEFDNIADSFLRNTKNLYSAVFFTSPAGKALTRASKIGIYRWLRTFVNANSKFGLYERIFENDIETDEFISNLLGERGFFSGKRIREYFIYLMETYLLAKFESSVQIPTEKTEHITFREFFDLTGVDLVLTGTNITRGQPKIFSLYFTPDFPVIEAVQISMNLPPAFKPTFVDTEVIKGIPRSKTEYFGLYIDGGMLNNYPIRSFDNLIEYRDAPTYLSDLTYRALPLSETTKIAGNPFEAQSNCSCFLGMRLEESTAPPKKIEKKDLFPDGQWAITDYLASLKRSFFYPSEEGQIRSAEDLRRTVRLSASGGERIGRFAFKELEKLGYFEDLEEGQDRVYTIPVEDFATPLIERDRKREGHYKIKNALIAEAGRVFREFLDE